MKEILRTIRRWAGSELSVWKERQERVNRANTRHLTKLATPI